MHQFGWLSERGGQLFKFASERGGFPQKRGGVPTLEETMGVSVKVVALEGTVFRFCCSSDEILENYCLSSTSPQKVNMK